MTYEEKKHRLITQAQTLIQKGCKLSLGKKTSNLFRSRKIMTKRLDVSTFDQGHPYRQRELDC